MTNQKDELEATEQTDSLVDLPLNELEADKLMPGVECQFTTSVSASLTTLVLRPFLVNEDLSGDFADTADIVD